GRQPRLVACGPGGATRGELRELLRPPRRQRLRRTGHGCARDRLEDDDVLARLLPGRIGYLPIYDAFIEVLQLTLERLLIGDGQGLLPIGTVFRALQNQRGGLIPDE